MAHLIENEMISYAGERPWHGLGTEVPAGTSGAEMLKLAKLDWTVEHRPLGMWNQERSKILQAPLSNYRAVVRTDTDQVFQVATQRYEPLQNAEVVDFFREYCEAGHATMETVGGLKGGAIVWALAKLEGGDRVLVDRASGVEDKLSGYMLLATSHDGSLRTIGRATQVRVVCWNTLSAAIGKATPAAGTGTFQMMHTRKWSPEIAAEARETMGMASEQLDKTNDLAAQLAAVTIDEKGWLEFMSGLLGGADAVLDPKKAQLTKTAAAIQEATMTSPGAFLPTAKGTLWGAVNGVTYYADHQRGRTQDSRLVAAWFGDGDRLKRSAVEVALQMAGSVA